MKSSLQKVRRLTHYCTLVSVCMTAQPASLKGRGFESLCIQFVADVKQGNRTLGLMTDFRV